MLHTLLSRLEGVTAIEGADAHCDIPCKIYDPAPALISALTVVRMMDIIAEEAGHGPDFDTKSLNTIARCIAQKETHAEELKREIRVIWGDYFKAPQMEKFPQIHDLTHSIMLTASKCRQGVDREDGLKLVELVNEFAEIFWATKDVKTKRAVAPYPPALEVVYPDL